MASHRVDTPAVVETRLVHDGQRRATSLLADVVADGAVPASAVAELRDFVVASLDHHHRSEDDGLWPLLTAAAPELADALDGLSREHDALDAALDELGGVVMDGVAGGPAIAAAVAVRDMVHEHLSHEEPVLLPALRAHVTDEQWAAFSRRTVETAPRRGTHLLVGLLDEVGTAEQVGLLLRHLPPQARDALPIVRLQGRSALTALAAGRGRGR
jgi:hemerythrin-like domain-containing protein